MELGTNNGDTIPKILMFSRGRGRGHVLVDTMIADKLVASMPVALTIASYGTGGRALAAGGVKFVDLGFSDNNPLLDTIVISSNLIAQVKPDLVVSHEEFGAVVGAKIRATPAIFLTDWFLDPGHILMQAIEYSDEILFLEHKGIFTEPPSLHKKISYVGPIIRPMKYIAGDKQLARGHMQIDAEAFIVTVLTGTTYESDSPILDLVIAGYDSLPYSKKHLFWVDSASYAEIARRLGEREDITVIQHLPSVESLIVASDVVINKCTRNILRECSILGVPSVSLSYGLNWIDDALAIRSQSNIALVAKNTSSDDLTAALRRAFAIETTECISHGDALNVVVERLSSHLRHSES